MQDLVSSYNMIVSPGLALAIDDREKLCITVVVMNGEETKAKVIQ